ncbi:MAG: RNA-binding transcriptional accessory protein [Oscillospiraceae bacterium]|nr:RNA-binding transcriptional accessory protein [Oscillospiraceae bacterium]
MDIIKTLCSELNIKKEQAENTVKLLDEGNTIAFIARYRKEVTGSLDDKILRAFYDRLNYLRSFNERSDEIIRLITEQGKMTDEILSSIKNAKILQELEDIYRPYKQKKRTRATIAKEKGLEGLANIILLQKENSGSCYDAAAPYVNAEKGVESADEAIAGASDIIAEMISDNAEYRKFIRNFTQRDGVLHTKNTKDEDSVYRMYYDFSEPLKKIADHRILAINRGEKEEFLSVSVEIDEDRIFEFLEKNVITNPNSIFTDILKETVRDAYKRLIAPSIEREVRGFFTENASENAIKLFSKNLDRLLMQPPIKGKTVLGIDPGYRTGCKVAVIDKTGKVCDTGIIFCTLEHHDKEKSKKYLLSLIKKYDVDLIAIGNGTASKESEMFVADVIKEADKKVYYLIVNEAGASVYSASKEGEEEFPDFTVEQRSAVSIARRCQDPLVEFVKIDPKSIGVGQYQHDMNQKRLKEALTGVVENCVNTVGVDLNTASYALLSYVSGINNTTAKNIVKYREENGEFAARKDLLKVDKIGPKAFLQCAGFLRIPDGEEILDNTGVHPESYKAAKSLLKTLGYTEEDVKNHSVSDIKERMNNIDIKEFCNKNDVGEITVFDIADSLLKPGRDVRDSLPKPILLTDVLSISDLKEGMILTGTVRNVTDFGAFVDIGVHQDGLVHISQICSRYIKNPTEVLAVGDIVKVKVLEADETRKRISLSIKQAQ